MADPFLGPDDEAGASAAAGPPVGQMSFEEALAELEGIVQKLERGQLDLESSIAAYERGTALRQHCADKLRQVELRVEKLGVAADGSVRAAPFEERTG